MNIEQLQKHEWFLAQYISGEHNRERLFAWLAGQHIIPWTPLTLSLVRRSDKKCGFRKRVTPVFPGYFFLKACWDVHSIADIRCHTAFCDFVQVGGTVAPVRPVIVEALMKAWPDPTLNSAARTELEAASHLRLSAQQFDYLLTLDQLPP